MNRIISKAVWTGLSLAIATLMCGCNASTGRTNVSIRGDQWLINGEPVLQGSPAEGLLMNVRMVNAVFEDLSADTKDKRPKDFDPGENTTRFIERMPDYYAHGVRAFTISLQGGMPGYEGAINTAFNADGTLRKEYLSRVRRVIHAADEQGIVVILSCFYQRQHSHAYALEGKQAIIAAVRNVAEWIRDEEFTNVVLEISNEHAHGGYNRWKDGEWLKSIEGQLELIQQAKSAAPSVLVSTSGMGSGRVSEDIARVVDFIIIHFNRTPLRLIPERIRELRGFGKPLLCNEDDKLGNMGAEAARISVQAGAGWGFMHIEKNQSVPFQFEGAADDPEVYNMLARLTKPGASIDDIPAEVFSVLITHPVDGDVFPYGQPVSIRAELTGIEQSEGIEVRFLASDTLIGRSAAAPWEISVENIPAGKYNVQAVVLGSKREELLVSGLVDFEVKAQ